MLLTAHPSRGNVPTQYIKEVGEPVKLLSGVGEGVLADHYHAEWFKGHLQLDNSNISRGEDFSLIIEAVELSDDGEYFSRVTISNNGKTE